MWWSAEFLRYGIALSGAVPESVVCEYGRVDPAHRGAVGHGGAFDGDSACGELFSDTGAVCSAGRGVQWMGSDVCDRTCEEIIVKWVIDMGGKICYNEENAVTL